MKKFLISLIILIVFGAAVFFIGWVELYIPVEKQAVMISKTSGVSDKIIKAGDLTWSWERLLPTNTKLRIFDIGSHNFSKTIKGTLPSAEVYKYMVDGNPNFSYNFSVKIVMNIKNAELPHFVEKTGATGQEELDTYLDTQAESIARSTVQYIIEESIEDIDYVVQASLSDTELIDGIKATTRYPDLDILSIQVNNITLPDVTMYNYAKESYKAYQEAIQVHLDEAAVLQGAQAAKDYLEIERLARLGKIIQDFPELVSFMAVTEGNFSYKLPEELPLISELAN